MDLGFSSNMDKFDTACVSHYICHMVGKGGKLTMKKQSSLGVLFDIVMTICTGGLWIIWVAIRYMRTH